MSTFAKVALAAAIQTDVAFTAATLCHSQWYGWAILGVGGMVVFLINLLIMGMVKLIEEVRK